MKLDDIKIVLGVCAIAVAGFLQGHMVGYRKAKAELPSCLYLNRPRQNDVKPWGCDGKEGIDWYGHDIVGGGILVDLSNWKCVTRR